LHDFRLSLDLFRILRARPTVKLVSVRQHRLRTKIFWDFVDLGGWQPRRDKRAELGLWSSSSIFDEVKGRRCSW
jgi:hypothetical protein